MNYFDVSYVFCFLLGYLIGAVEITSRYRDAPSTALTYKAGLLYCGINGIICCVALFLSREFYLTPELDESYSDIAQSTSEILAASLGATVILRSSFLKLKGENGDIDFGLNIIINKILNVTDINIDRKRSAERAKEITELLSECSIEYVINKLAPFCISLMQNMSHESKQEILSAISNTDTNVDMEFSSDDIDVKKYTIGLTLYNIVGLEVLKVAKESYPPKDDEDKVDAVNYTDVIFNIADENKDE